MTIPGSGGVVIESISYKNTFKKQYKKLPSEIKKLVESKLKDLQKDPMPPGLRFEKLKGYRRPDIFTIHITGNYKISLEINGPNALLRCVGCHNNIDRSP